MTSGVEQRCVVDSEEQLNAQQNCAYHHCHGEVTYVVRSLDENKRREKQDARNYQESSQFIPAIGRRWGVKVANGYHRGQGAERRDTFPLGQEFPRPVGVL